MRLKEFLSSYEPGITSPILLRYVLVALKDSRDVSKFSNGLTEKMIRRRVRTLMVDMDDPQVEWINMAFCIQQALDYGRGCQLIVRHNTAETFYLAQKRGNWTPVRRINFEEAPQGVRIAVGLRQSRTRNEQEYAQLVRQFLPAEFADTYLN